MSQSVTLRALNGFHISPITSVADHTRYESFSLVLGNFRQYVLSYPSAYKQPILSLHTRPVIHPEVIAYNFIHLL